ncbi:MAG: hypothetical protein Q7S87_08720 [Agitococcus sp.]|nr:hypothetical protein [Agitococcus sp.]
MRPKLLKSFTIVILFWLFATSMYWSFQKPEINLAALVKLKGLFPFLPVTVPTEARILGSLAVQRDVFLYWSIPVLIIAVVSGIAGFVFVWMLALKSDKSRTARETGSGNFRGVTITLGALPVPDVLPKDDIDLGSDDNEALNRVTERERRLLCDILGTISAQPKAYAGPGITIPLLDHTLNLVTKALSHRKYPGVSAIVAAANELGNLTAYQLKDKGDWVSTKSHTKESARILASLDSWSALPLQDRGAVMLAVKYYTTPRLIPELDGDPQTYRYARELLAVADDAQMEVVTEEKQRTLEKTELPDVLFDAFLRALPQLSFQSRGLPKGVQAVAWKIGSRVYLLEIKLRETVMAKLPQDVRGALSPTQKDKQQKLQPFTHELLKALEVHGWLVRKIDAIKLDAKEALWNVKAGKLEFKGVIIIDVPPEYLSQLPTEDSMYEVAVTGSLFTPGGSGVGTPMSKTDLVGLVLNPPSETITKQE